MCLISVAEFEALAEKYASDFVRSCPDSAELSEKFWINGSKKLKSFYAGVRREDDIVMSASFSFLLEPVSRIMNVKRLVCSEVDTKSGEVGTLCFGKNKARLFEKMFPGETIDDFYTDSLNDKPMMELAKGNVYIVNKEKITLYKRTEKR